jgi:oligopeptide transport system ATP-binding protein
VPDALLHVDGLEVIYHTRSSRLPALHDIGFTVAPGEIVGIVGESGCGKSTLSAAIMGLLPPNGEITAGNIELEGRELRTLPADALRDVRGRQIAMIFQDPMSSLNPTFRIGTQLMDAQRAHLPRGGRDDRALRAHAVSVLRQVGIPDAEERLSDFPHQFSGGMRQRVMIAMALALEPKLMIADEPTTALDVTIQAQVLELLRGLTEQSGSAMILITHDLGVVAGMTNRINVMYAGYIVETATTLDTFAEPSHPYTIGLLHSIPRVDAVVGEPLIPIEGRPPDMRRAPSSCPFAPRCRWRLEICWEDNPPLRPTVEGTPIVMSGPAATHQIACHNPPTREEAIAGKPLRPGFSAAPPPSGFRDEVGAGRIGSTADLEEMVADIQGEEGPLSMAPSAGGLPLPPEPEHHGDRGIFHDD